MRFAPFMFFAPLIACWPCSFIIAQDIKDKWTPSIAPRISLEQLAVAKITKSPQGDSQISVLIPQWRTEQRTGEFKMTKCRKETRIVTIPDPSGSGTIEKSVVVAIPYSETVTRTYEVKIPEKSRRVDVPWDQANLLKASGEVIERTAEVEKILASPQHVFLLNSPNAEFVCDEYHRSLLSKEFYVLWIEPNLLLETEK